MRWPPGAHRGSEGPREEPTLGAFVLAGTLDETRALQVELVGRHWKTPHGEGGRAGW